MNEAKQVSDSPRTHNTSNMSIHPQSMSIESGVHKVGDWQVVFPESSGETELTDNIDLLMLAGQDKGIFTSFRTTQRLKPLKWQACTTHCTFFVLKIYLIKWFQTSNGFPFPFLSIRPN